MTKVELLINAIQCKTCGVLIESVHRHDYQTCPCGSVSVDGGDAYRKRSWNPEGRGYLEQSVWRGWCPECADLTESVPGRAVCGECEHEYLEEEDDDE
jgi:Zn finger protein HypA/HybF involved in hydrogenase expression